MDKKWFWIGVAAIGALLLMPKKARKRVRALSGLGNDEDENDEDEKEYFYRVTSKEDDLINTKSVELPASLFTKKEALEMLNVRDEDDLPETLHWIKGKGLCYDGVCAVSDPDWMREYLRSSGLDQDDEGAVVVKFEGEDIGSCSDGVVVKPSRIIKKWSVLEFVKNTNLSGLPMIDFNTKRCMPDITKNKIRCRVQEPEDFQSFFTRTSTTPGVKYVMGQAGKGAITQSVLFDKKIWNDRQARKWFNRNINRLLERDRKALNLQSLYGGKTHSEDYFSPRQQEMFPKLRRELVLEADEPQESILDVDPLDKCLERKGWDLHKVRKYQDNISAKMTVDMFGKTEKLTGTEVMLQENIQQCLERMVK